MTAEVQRENVQVAARALAPIALDHELVISHGNGPQVGLLALQSDAFTDVEPYPLDVLGAQTEGMIGYMIEQELGNLMPYEQPFATILTMVEVDPRDPAFDNPTKPIGPVYSEEDAKHLAEQRGWAIAKDGKMWRRVVPSPKPQHIFEIRPIRWLIEHGVIVICTGGGGIPTMYKPGRVLQGAEVVIDKDRASELLARELGADMIILATDVDGVYANWGEPDAKLLHKVTLQEMSSYAFPAGSMGPKVEAACRFIEAGGASAGIGRLEDAEAILAGRTGTRVEAEVRR